MIYKGMLGIVITTIIIIALSYRGGLSGAQDSTQTGCSDGNSSRESSRHRACPDPS